MIQSYVDPNFKLVKPDENKYSDEYLDYRRKWVENPKNFIVERAPIHLDIETHTSCNLKCIMCHQSFDPPVPQKMPDETVYRLIDEAKEIGVCSLKFQYRGEPLLDARMPQFVKYAKERGIIEVMFNTNSTLLTKSMANELIDSGLDKIICSVDGYQEGMYEEIRVGSNFHRVLENIRELQKTKKERKSRHPILRVQMVVPLENKDKINEYTAFWEKIADIVGVEELLNYNIQEEDYLEKPDFACAQIWQRLIVMADGDVLPCCKGIRGGNEKLEVVGNIYKNSLEEIWNNPRMKELRELHQSGQSHKIKMCRLCGLRALY
ncbi:Coenzyme PQQ synthesis protein E [anaerobic digester metagenome]